jgi:hypothetical protein
VWKSNGVAAGTFLVQVINPHKRGSYAPDLNNVNGTLFFNASDGVNGVEPWVLGPVAGLPHAASAAGTGTALTSGRAALVGSASLLTNGSGLSAGLPFASTSPNQPFTPIATQLSASLDVNTATSAGAALGDEAKASPLLLRRDAKQSADDAFFVANEENDVWGCQ